MDRLNHKTVPPEGVFAQRNTVRLRRHYPIAGRCVRSASRQGDPMLEREKVVCKKCGSEMKAILTVPHKPGFVEQTLECVKCVRRERKIRDTRFSIKP